MYVQHKYILISFVILLLYTGICHSGVPGLTKFFRNKRLFQSSWVPVSTITRSMKENKKQQQLQQPQEQQQRKQKNSSSRGNKLVSGYEVDHLCIDMNQFLHASFKVASDSKHLMARIYAGIDNIINTVQPRKSLVLAFDGPAPFAKMQTQRSRRTNRPESCLITPGTDFMMQIEDVMICYALQRIQKEQFQNVTFFISGASSPGEGELKLVDWINTHMKAYCNDTIVICGADSDILLQAISLGKVPQLLVYQSDAGMDYDDAFCNTTSLVTELLANVNKEKMYNFEDSDGMSEGSLAVTSTAKGKDKNSTVNATTAEAAAVVSQSTRLDFVFLFMLQGNDYLPKLRSVTIHHAMTAYSLAMKKLPINERYLIDVDKMTFNFVALYLFMKELQILVESISVSLPIVLPTSVHYLNTYLQKSATNVTWNDTRYDDASGTHWSACVSVGGVTYNTGDDRYTSKKDAKRALATSTLLSMDPKAYVEMMDDKKSVKKSLQQLRKAVIDEDIVRNNDSNIDATDTGSQFDDATDDVTDDDDVDEDRYFSSITNDAYSKYVRDSDIECYMQGILWVLQMYIEGVCPDVSYTYTGRPAISPYIILQYMEKAYSKHRPTGTSDASITNSKSGIGKGGLAYHDLVRSLRLPTSPSKPLSAAATLVCVIPKIGGDYIPTHLKTAWKQTQLHLADDSLKRVSYAALSTIISDIWRGVGDMVPTHGHDATGSTSNSTVPATSSDRNSRGSRKERRQLSSIRKAYRFNGHKDKAVMQKLKSIFVDDSECRWSVLTKSIDLKAAGYASVFKQAYLKLPLTVPFATPSKLPANVRVYHQMHRMSTTNRHTRSTAQPASPNVSVPRASPTPTPHVSASPRALPTTTPRVSAPAPAPAPPRASTTFPPSVSAPAPTPTPRASTSAPRASPAPTPTPSV